MKSLFPTFLSQRIERLLKSWLSNRIKRIIYVGSILGVVAGEKHSNVAFMEKVNMFLKLAKRSSALMFPAYIGNFIWRNLQSQKVHLGDKDLSIGEMQIADIPAQDYLTLGELFSKSAPEWLQYAPVEKMASDVFNTLFISQKLICA